MTVDFALFQEVLNLQLRYAQALDSNDISAWPDFFTDDGIYKLQSRENFDRHLPLCILSFESKDMMVDRVYGVVNTIYHDPYSQRHVCGVPLITGFEGEQIECESSVVVIRTPRDAMPYILCAGRYIDKLTREGGEKGVKGELKFAERLVIFDNDLIPNSIIKPI